MPSLTRVWVTVPLMPVRYFAKKIWWFSKPLLSVHVVSFIVLGVKRNRMSLLFVQKWKSGRSWPIRKKIIKSGSESTPESAPRANRLSRSMWGAIWWNAFVGRIFVSAVTTNGTRRIKPRLKVVWSQKDRKSRQWRKRSGVSWKSWSTEWFTWAGGWTGTWG